MRNRSVLALFASAALTFSLASPAMSEIIFNSAYLEQTENNLSKNLLTLNEHRVQMSALLDDYNNETTELLAYYNNKENANNPEYANTERQLREIDRRFRPQYEKMKTKILHINHETMDSLALMLGVTKAASDHCAMPFPEKLFPMLEKLNQLLNTKMNPAGYNTGYNLPHIANSAYETHQKLPFDNALCDSLPERIKRYEEQTHRLFN